MRPITLTMKVRWWLAAVLVMASTASVMRCRALSAPMVISVPEKSLSIEPTMPDDQQVPVLACLLGGDLSLLDKLVQQGGPFLPEKICAGQRAIAADDDQAVDPVLDQVQGCLSAAFARAELIAAGRADDRPALVQNPTDRIPIHPADARAAFHQSHGSLHRRRKLQHPCPARCGPLRGRRRSSPGRRLRW